MPPPSKQDEEKVGGGAAAWLEGMGRGLESLVQSSAPLTLALSAHP